MGEIERCEEMEPMVIEPEKWVEIFGYKFETTNGCELNIEINNELFFNDIGSWRLLIDCVKRCHRVGRTYLFIVRNRNNECITFKTEPWGDYIYYIIDMRGIYITGRCTDDVEITVSEEHKTIDVCNITIDMGNAYI